MHIKHRVELPSLMKYLGLPMIAVELGCAEGLSAKDFLDAGIEKLYMVDLWATINGQSGDGGYNQEWHDKNYNDARSRMIPYGNKVEFRRGYTNEMAFYVPDNLGLVYVDADHSLKGVQLDIETYYPKLVSGGIMAFHDYEAEAYGVKQAVKEFAKKNNLEILTLPENKKEDAGAFFFKP